MLSLPSQDMHVSRRGRHATFGGNRVHREYQGQLVSRTLACVWSTLYVSRAPRRVEFFGNREELDRKYPLSQQLHPGNEVYGVWLTGESVFTAHRNALKSNVVRGVILPHPKSDNLKTLAASLSPQESLYNLEQQIKTITEIAKRYHIPVKWYRGGFVGSNILIANPESRDGWAHIVVRLPFADPDKFWAMRLQRVGNEEEFIRLWHTFKKLWDGSDEPDIST